MRLIMHGWFVIITNLRLCKCCTSAFASVRNHVWPVDPNSEAYRNRGQKHGKREKFRRQPSERAPYKAADVAQGGRVTEGAGVGRPHQRRAGNYVSGRPFVRLQSATAQVLREADGLLRKASANAGKGRQGTSRGQERAAEKERERAVRKAAARPWPGARLKNTGARRRTELVAVNISDIRLYLSVL